jgi:hypothetical protein
MAASEGSAENVSRTTDSGISDRGQLTVPTYVNATPSGEVQLRMHVTPTGEEQLRTDAAHTGDGRLRMRAAPTGDEQLRMNTADIRDSGNSRTAGIHVQRNTDCYRNTRAMVFVPGSITG